MAIEHMKQNFDRRQFIRTASTAAMGLGVNNFLNPYPLTFPHNGGRVGIIGLDTSHSVAFTKALNAPNSLPELEGYKVVAAYPRGSADIESSVKRIAGYTEDVKKLGVEIVSSINDLLKKVDFVLLETNDGRPHLDQALLVLKAGKPMFIDKPVAGSLKDAIAIYETAKKYKVPIFSSSSLRYMESVQDVVKGKIGNVLGADTFSPATIEKTHPDLFWYGIHGIEILFTLMGVGCQQVSRVHTNDTDIVVGTWKDGRIGTFRGTRTGKHDYGGTVYGEKGNISLGPFNGYDNLLVQIINFFRTGIMPVNPEETLEIYAFMEAADESKRRNGAAVSLEAVIKRPVK
jgi:predicted dehydrogenase